MYPIRQKICVEWICLSPPSYSAWFTRDWSAVFIAIKIDLYFMPWNSENIIWVFLALMVKYRLPVLQGVDSLPAGTSLFFYLVLLWINKFSDQSNIFHSWHLVVFIYNNLISYLIYDRCDPGTTSYNNKYFYFYFQPSL